MATWPSDIPQEFDEEGFSDELPDELLRSELSGGEPKTRRLARRGNSTPIEGRMTVTADEWYTLLDFYRDDLADGTLQFDFPDPDDTSETIPVAFAEPPALSTLGGLTHLARLRFERQG